MKPTGNEIAYAVAVVDAMKAELEAWRQFGAACLGDDDFVTGCPGHAARVRELLPGPEQNSCPMCGSGPGGPV